MKKGFTLVELLAVIVILAILMVSAGAGITSTMNNSKVNIFKDEVLTFMDGAQRAYSEISMTPALYDYIKSDETSTSAGVCISIAGLINNGYVEKDIQNYAGIILLEVPYDNGPIHTTAWVHNGTNGVNGIGRELINKIKFNKDNNTTKITNSGETEAADANDYSGGPVGVVTNLTGIKKLIGKVYPSTSSVGIPNDIQATKEVARIDTYANRGGEGKTYKNITCINGKI